MPATKLGFRGPKLPNNRVTALLGQDFEGLADN
jgi:hypothetical protein